MNVEAKPFQALKALSYISTQFSLYIYSSKCMWLFPFSHGFFYFAISNTVAEETAYQVALLSF